jgi:hypothetical protein
LFSWAPESLWLSIQVHPVWNHVKHEKLT